MKSKEISSISILNPNLLSMFEPRFIFGPHLAFSGTYPQSGNNTFPKLS